MRNPARIYPLLNKIGDVWIKNPDLRLGQLIYVILSDLDDDVYADEMFGIEDDRFETLVDAYAKKSKKHLTNEDKNSKLKK